jgi:tetratricopeptide (TPR) repeat protein
LLADAAPPSSEGLNRFDLFDAVTAWLSELAEAQPLWIGIEDLHAADPESLALLEALAVSLKTTRILLVGTLRDAALSSTPQGSVYQRVVRQAQVLTLPRLEREAARKLLLADLQSRDEAFIASALDASEGHPLFLVELVRLARLAGSDVALHELVPASIQAVFEERLRGISRQSLDVLTRAALIGMDVDRDLLTHWFDAVDEGLGEATRDSLIRQLGRKSWRFSHAMLRDTLQATLSDESLEQAHLEIAEALSARGAAPAAVAHHLHRAGRDRLEAACGASLQAAQQSLARFAFEDALTHVNSVRQRLRPGSEPILRARCGVVEGQALLGLGHIDEGLRTCLTAADIAKSAGATQVLAEAALAYGSVFRFATVDQTLVSLIEQALALLGPGDSPLVAQLLARLAAALQPDPQPERPIALAREALAMAERVGDVHVLVASLRSACSALVDLAHPAQRRQLDQRHLDLAIHVGLGTDELRARQRLAFDCMELGDFATAWMHLDQAERIAESGPHPRYRWLVPALSALRDLWKGNLEHTQTLIEEARALGEASGDRNARLAYVFQSARFIELSGTEADAHGVARALGEAMAGTSTGERLSALARARFLLELGRTEEGIAAVDRPTLDAVLACGDRTALYGIARWAAAAGDAALGRLVLERFHDQAHFFVAEGVVGLCWRAPLAFVLAYAAEATGDFEGAIGWANSAARAAAGAGGYPAAAECHGLAARLSDQLGRAEEAQKARLQARACIEGLGLSGLERRLAGTDAAGSDSVVSGGQSRPAPPAADDRSSFPEFREEGDVVCITWRGRSVRVRATKGISVLGYLVARPGVAVHVLDLTHSGQAHPPVDRGDAGELLDAPARVAYRSRAAELREELEEAERHLDLGRRETLKRELEFIAGELSRGSALGRSGRRVPAAEERARQAIRKQVRTSLDHLAGVYPELSRYLERAVQTGRTCLFEP